MRLPPMTATLRTPAAFFAGLAVFFAGVDAAMSCSLLSIGVVRPAVERHGHVAQHTVASSGLVTAPRLQSSETFRYQGYARDRTQPVMTDKYQDMAHNPIGKFLVKQLGLPNPPYLERYKGGPLVSGSVLIGSAGETPISKAVQAGLKSLKIDNTGVYASGKKYKGLVFDASSIDSAQGLVALQEFFSPVLRQLASCGRVVVIGSLPDEAATESAAIAQRALEGFTRSLGKEIGNGSTANLVYVAKGAETSIASTLGFFLSPKSAYVSGQVIRVGATGITVAPEVKDFQKPLAGKVALVTGASR